MARVLLSLAVSLLLASTVQGLEPVKDYVNEDDGNVTLAVNVDDLTNGVTYTVEIDRGDSTASEADIELLTTSVTVTTGVMVDLDLRIHDDTLVEGNETVKIEFEKPGAIHFFTITLVDVEVDVACENLTCNDGTCVSNGTHGSCVCNPSSYGEFCDNPYGGNAFDCNRPGQNCFGNADVCDKDSPRCQCMGTPPNEGVMCDIVTADKDGPGCESMNCNNGTCVSNGTVGSCMCHPGFYGEFCDIPYVAVECFADYMIIYFNPVGTFNGRFNVKDKYDEASCVAMPIPEPPGDGLNEQYQGYYLRVNNTSPECGNVTVVERAQSTNVERELLLSHITGIITGRDQMFTARCYFNRQNHVISGGSLTANQELDLDALDRDEVSNTFMPIELDVSSGVDVLNTSVPVAIETPVCFTVSVPAEQGAVEISNVVVNSSNEGGNPYEWILYNNWCPGDGVSTINFVEPYYTVPKSSARFCFDMFYVKPSGEINVWMTVSTCLEPNLCGVTTCSSSSSSVTASRRKRDAEEKSSQNVEVILIAEDPALRENSDVAAQGSSCTGISCQAYFLPVVCSLAALCVMLLALALLLVFLRRRRNKQMSQ